MRHGDVTTYYRSVFGHLRVPACASAKSSSLAGCATTLAPGYCSARTPHNLVSSTARRYFARGGTGVMAAGSSAYP